MKYGCFCRVKCAANFTHLHTNTCLSMHKSAIMHRRSSAIAIVVVDIINKPTNAISSNSDRQPENVYVHNCYTKKSTVSFAKCNVTMLLLLLLLYCVFCNICCLLLLLLLLQLQSLSVIGLTHIFHFVAEREWIPFYQTSGENVQRETPHAVVIQTK